MQLLKKIWEFLQHIYNRISETRVLEAAAAIAYYAIFSFFPLVLFIVAFNASFLKSPEVQAQILKFADSYLPGSEGMVQANITHLIQASGTVGILGTIVLLWSATLVFAGFSQNINLAWTHAESRHFLTERLIGLMMIGMVIIFLILILIFNTLIDILPKFFPNMVGHYLNTMSGLNHLLIDYLPFLTIFCLFVVVYRYVPNVKVLWREAFVGAFFAAVALELTKTGFVWYLSLGTSSYQVIYGSLGAVVAFMLWIYISASIILIGGHLCAATAHYIRPEEMKIIENAKDPEVVESLS
ncbi:MAG: YihY/virulence factor BrkB family protein [Candidatus Rifleibacteriota bacterium]